MSGTDSEGDDLVFLSPEESLGGEEEEQAAGKGQGASPNLRRSSRKIKSVNVPGNMSKNSATKKKKSSQDPGKRMPRIPRTPQGATAGADTQPASDLEALLLAMERRLTDRIEKASEAAKEAASLAKTTNEALEDLELRVEASEVCIRGELKDTEERVMRAVEDKVKDMVDNQLRAAGFDQDLSAGDLTVRSSVQQNSYAGVTAALSGASSRFTSGTEGSSGTTKENRQEEKFWKARRSLRIWPLSTFDRDGVAEFLLEKLKMEKEFVGDDLGTLVVS